MPRAGLHAGSPGRQGHYVRDGAVNLAAFWKRRHAPAENETGLAAEDTFWARVRALGGKRDYPPPPMHGLP